MNANSFKNNESINIWPKTSILLTIAFCLLASFCSIQQKNETMDRKVGWGKSRLLEALQKAGAKGIAVSITVDSTSSQLADSVRKPEGYRAIVHSDSVEVVGYDAAGAMYGCLSLADNIEQRGSLPDSFDIGEAPFMALRGTCIFLMKLGTYNYPITPQEFPFFYDKKLWLKYLDFLASKRFNYIAFWNGHPFAYFVKLDKYPEAQRGMEPKLLQRNHDMLMWLCSEGAKRNIRFMFEFYNIHTSVYFQKAHNLADENQTPTPLLSDYTAYCIERFVSEFPQVGLYITPGEALELEYADKWLNEVIFPAIQRSGRTPPVFVRAWSIDLEHAKKLVGHYPDLYFERKYNVEMIAGTAVDPENAEWARLTGKHVVNIHCVANLEPFRWNPPLYIQKCLQSAVQAGANGLHLYPRKAWRWPYGCDIGEKQLQWHRDALWFEMWGRYAWNPNREMSSEREYWLQRLSERFGNRGVAEQLLNSFEHGADVLPALQRLIWLGNDNHTVVSAGAKLSALRTAQGIPFLPLEVTCISDYLDNIGRSLQLEKSPIQFLQKIVQQADESYKEALAGAKLATKNQEETKRIVSDAQAVALVAKFYHHKLIALEKKVLSEKGIDPAVNEDSFFVHLNRSVEIFRELTELTTKTYESLSDVPAWNPERLKTCPYHWKDILPIYERELTHYQEERQLAKDPAYHQPSLPGLAGIWYGDPGLKNAKGPEPLDSLNVDWRAEFNVRERRWSAQWFGYLVPPIDGNVTFHAKSDQGLTLFVGGEKIIDWRGAEGVRQSEVNMKAGQPVPIRIIYDHNGGKTAYMKVNWSWSGHLQSTIHRENLRHSPAQEREMKSSILSDGM